MKREVLLEKMKGPAIFRAVKQEWKRWRVRRNYKDHLFIKLFHDKENLLELYNALNGTDYKNPKDLVITTIDDAVYMGMKNDCSFLIGHDINLYEHQSTYCPNMPIRGIIYLADAYRSIIEGDNLNLYGSRLIKLPTPKYIVFYNGESNRAEREELRISDAFETKDGCLEFTATMININKGHNQELMEKCRMLKDYSLFIDKVREYKETKSSLKEAIDEASVYCMKHDIMKDYLIKHRNEVRDVLLTEFNANKQREMDRRDAREEGRIGERIDFVIKKVKKGQNLEEISNALEIPPEELESIYQVVLEEKPEFNVEKIYRKILEGR